MSTSKSESTSKMAKFTIAVSSCALFKSENEDMPGVAFPFVKALNMVNQRLDQLGQANEKFKIVLITTNSQERALERTERLGLKIVICEITAQRSLFSHLEDLKPVLYLSTNSKNVKEAIRAGHGAATLFQRDYPEPSEEKLHVAFDGDGVLFSDESEKIYKEKGLAAFKKNEKDCVDIPLKEGPLNAFLKALVSLQQKYNERPQECPIRTYLVTSRGPAYPGIRALKSLQAQKLDIDEAFFLSGSRKGPVLKSIKPHIFFDDQVVHVKTALDNNVMGAHVPFGVRNEYPDLGYKGGVMYACPTINPAS